MSDFAELLPAVGKRHRLSWAELGLSMDIQCGVPEVQTKTHESRGQCAPLARLAGLISLFRQSQCLQPSRPPGPQELFKPGPANPMPAFLALPAAGTKGRLLLFQGEG